MKCRAICDLPQMTMNGKSYVKGEFVMFVNVSKEQFEANNRQTTVTGLKFIKESDKPDDKKLRKALFQKADELGIKVPKNVKTEILKEKIENFKPDSE